MLLSWVRVTKVGEGFPAPSAELLEAFLGLASSRAGILHARGSAVAPLALGTAGSPMKTGRFRDSPT